MRMRSAYGVMLGGAFGLTFVATFLLGYLWEQLTRGTGRYDAIGAGGAFFVATIYATMTTAGVAALIVLISTLRWLAQRRRGQGSSSTVSRD